MTTSGTTLAAEQLHITKSWFEPPVLRMVITKQLVTASVVALFVLSFLVIKGMLPVTTVGYAAAGIGGGALLISWIGHPPINTADRLLELLAAASVIALGILGAREVILPNHMALGIMGTFVALFPFLTCRSVSNERSEIESKKLARHAEQCITEILDKRPSPETLKAQAAAARLKASAILNQTK